MVSRTQDRGGLVRQSVLGMEQGLSGRNGYRVRGERWREALMDRTGEWGWVGAQH